jgi:hypothetical protein
MKFFNHLAVLALLTAGLLLSACGKGPDEAARELFTQKMEQNFGYVTLAADVAGTEHEHVPIVATVCITAEKVRADYARELPTFKLSNVDSKTYIEKYNAEPPRSSVEAPEELIVADDGKANFVILIGFKGGCYYIYTKFGRPSHDRVMKAMLGSSI